MRVIKLLKSNPLEEEILIRDNPECFSDITVYNSNKLINGAIIIQH